MNAVHPVAPEDVMAYLDGELPAAQGQDIEAHLAGCGACRELLSELQEGSTRMGEWRVQEPPPSLVSPRSRRPIAPKHPAAAPWPLRAWTWATRAPMLAGAAAVVLIATIPLLRPSPTPVMVAGSREQPETIVDAPVDRLRAQGVAGGNANAAPMRVGGQIDSASRVESADRSRIVRTATLRLVAANFDRIRPAVDRILQNVGGFAGTLTASSRPGAPRSINGTLRIPSARFDAALAELRQLGRVTEESQNAQDVTATVADLDARLSNSRVIEKRLTEVLQSRTGDVGDVLEVEREIARVRGEIEQMEAERKQLERRIEYATLTLEIVEERAAAVNLGPVPIPTRLRLAVADGIASAATSMLAVTLLLLRRGPALLLWALILAPPVWWMLRRRSAQSGT
jgi:anti-sigma factor RsiW